jgi:quinoprotein glucose dehydrogenase
VDLKTGKRKWHFQVVHHPIWDYDLSSAPILADINVGGKAIKAVALPSKEAFLYVFDRVTGEPVWPIVERPVPQSDVPGEKTSPTQPFPTKPPAYGRQYVKVPDDLIDFTPELRAQAKDNVARYKTGPMFLPPIVGDNNLIGALTLGTASGGTNWPGASFDPETHIAYAYACNACLTPIGVVPSKPEISDMKYVMGMAGRELTIARGPGENAGADSPKPPPPDPKAMAAAMAAYTALNVQGLPLIKPPYGTISAINLDRGDIQWQTPHGDTPDAIRNNPALKGMKLDKLGQTTYNVGTLVTKSLVIAGDGLLTTTADHPRGAMLRAYDKATGKEVGAVFMQAPQSGSPMTYAINGKQYIIVATSGGNYSGEYIAFTLPETETPTSTAPAANARQR